MGDYLIDPTTLNEQGLVCLIQALDAQVEDFDRQLARLHRRRDNVDQRRGRCYEEWHLRKLRKAVK